MKKNLQKQNFSRRKFIKAGTILAAASAVAPGCVRAAAFPSGNAGNTGNKGNVFEQFACPQWLKDAKFGLWLHWGPQSIPTRGAGWYARHLYMAPDDPAIERFGKEAWEYHRRTFGHQADFGYKDLCRLWKAEKFDADATVKRFKEWGARYVAVIANHHDNYDLFSSSVHDWNAAKVGPKRDILGEFAAAARRHQLKWAATAHASRARRWMAPSVGADRTGPRAGEPYDGNLTAEDGKCAWWSGLNPRQLYAVNHEPFERELAQRLTELAENYRPDMLYFDDDEIPALATEACRRLYENSLKTHGSIQAVVTVKKEQKGTLRDYEKGIADGIRNEYWQTDTSLNEDWFLKADVDKNGLRHDARTLKELLVDIVSKRGVMLLNIPVNADGSIPDDQAAIMEELGAWLRVNGEAIYETVPWKTYGENGDASGGHFNERTVKSAPWNHEVVRFTANKKGTIIYVHVFGNPAGKELSIASFANPTKTKTKIRNVALLGSDAKIKWTMKPDGLHVSMPETLPCKDCNVLSAVVR
ncbi:MAG: alpha-L-fucosidase [Prevotellaceae bacterium]|jgi:alpha-L-fucosidase|nr:alpha-L-fucosidase [Prevotellaceae bacterium]